MRRRAFGANYAFVVAGVTFLALRDLRQPVDEPAVALCADVGRDLRRRITLPFLDFSAGSLTLFAVFYGLDWIATVPPTVKLTNQGFGEGDVPIVFGWVLVGHQIGAASAAFGAGLVRSETGSHAPAFLAAGLMDVVAALLAPSLA